MADDNLSRGQRLALDQLSDIVDASNDAVEIVRTELPSSDGGSLLFHLSIETIEYERKVGGFKFRQREPFRVSIPSRFPIEPPSANFGHHRFAGHGHVQWGSHLCLYQSVDVEWVASDGMFGFFKRLDEWLRDAACDRLDPNDAPLHPPIEYPSSVTKFSVEIDSPEIDEGSQFWMGSAKLTDRNKYCYDISEWTETPSTLPKDQRFAPVILLSQAMPTEYPETISTLIVALRERGIPFELLFSILKLLALCQKEGEPLFFVLGAPMRRRAAGERLRQHLTAWKMDPEYVKALQTIVLECSEEETEAAWKRILDWATKTKVEWCRVYDNRPEVTFRRDLNTSASWFLGKTVVLLGCGAIGSHVGEYLARAGVKKLLLVDQSTVNPGIIVRQQFKHYQVGYSKQSALAIQLGTISPGAEIRHEFANLTKGWPDSFVLNEFDMIIDATASRRVASALQLDWMNLNGMPPVLRCAINSDASLGIATLTKENSSSGPADLIRQTKMTAIDTPELSDFAASFWPKEQQEAGFQPEPGCSEPTFVGSAADIAFFASSFFNFASRSMNFNKDSCAKAIFVRAADSCNSMSSCEVPIMDHDLNYDVLHGYRVHLSPAAKKAVESEIKSNARTGSDKDETGGLLLGEIDDSLQSITIDVATGPPPDSKKSPQLFICGVEGTEILCEYNAEKSSHSTKFVGVWHTHPVSMPEPSEIDISAMAQILHHQQKAPRHVVMLIVGHASKKPEWRFHLFRRNEFTLKSIESEVISDDR